MSEFGSRDPVVTAVISQSGTFIRYAFYAAGTVAFALVAIAILRINSFVTFNSVKLVADAPSFRLVDGELLRLSMKSKVISGGSTGRIEIRHYGQSYDRGTNFSIALVIRPRPSDQVVGPTFADVRSALAMASYGGTTDRYDLETRFGSVRASETRINADGRIKPCLTFYSRFQTEAVRIEGGYCEADGSKPDAQRLACILDGMVLDTKLANPEADAFLRERMARRPHCSSTPVSQTLDTRYKPMSPPSRWSMPSARYR
jgi:hypothetical protein